MIWDGHLRFRRFPAASGSKEVKSELPASHGLGSFWGSFWGIITTFEAAAGAAAAADWAQPDFGNRETVLDVLAEAERLAAVVA